MGFTRYNFSLCTAINFAEQIMDYWRALTQNFGYALQINTLLAKTANKKHGIRVANTHE